MTFLDPSRCRCGCAQHVHAYEPAEQYAYKTEQGNWASPVQVTRQRGHTGRCHLCGRCSYYQPADDQLKPGGG